MHGLDATDNDACGPKILEPEHWPRSTFDGPVILLDDVVQVVALTDPDRRLAPRVHGVQGSQIGAAFVHGDRLRRTVLGDRFLEVATRGGFLAVGSQQEVDGVMPTGRLCRRNAFSNSGSGLTTQRCTLEWCRSDPLVRLNGSLRQENLVGAAPTLPKFAILLKEEV
jgi:hypothetical protein